MNDGKGIPVEMHKEHDMFVPTLIFGHLLTSSNYDDSQKKVRFFLKICISDSVYVCRCMKRRIDRKSFSLLLIE